MNHKRIVLLGGKGTSTNAVFNAIDNKFGVELAIVEEKESSGVFLKRRIKKLGILNVFGQILFKVFESTVLRQEAKERASLIVRNSNLDFTRIPNEKIRRVKSVNSQKTIEILRKKNPDLVIVNGTRIISKKVLKSIDCKFINIHTGITPKYRGVHGGYWALVNNDNNNCGVTVHFVNEGIDTGNVIAQKKIIVTSKDNFTTIPLIQLESGINLLIEVINSVHRENEYSSDKIMGDSKLFYHPTLWEYLYYRLVKKIK